MKASDPVLDPRDPTPWGEEWLNVVAMRHFHHYLEAAGEFHVTGEVAGAVPTVVELRALRVQLWDQVALPPTHHESHVGAGEARRGAEKPGAGASAILQVMDCDWLADPEGEPQVGTLFTQRAWLLGGGVVSAQLWPRPGPGA